MIHDGAKPAAALCASANLQSLFTNFSRSGLISMRLFEPAQGGGFSPALEN
jgi:hypothetical protein